MFRPIRASFLLPVLLLPLACRTDESRALVLGDPTRGFELAEGLGCASCHAAPGLAVEPAPRLDRVGARLTPAGIAAALAASARMPAVALEPAQRDALVHFLASLGGPLAAEPFSADALTLERGRQLYHSVGCVACHAPFERAETLARRLWDFEDAYESRTDDARLAHETHGGPRDPRDLAGIAARTTRAALTEYLREPVAVHPAGRMPSLGLSAGEAADVAAYLFYEDVAALGAVLAPGPGLLLDYHEGSFPDETVDFDALAPVRTEVATSWFDGIARSEEDFGFRFRGLVEVPAEGMYRFTTVSDDGSMLYVDGALVVDNRGQHAMSPRSGEVFLTAGRHALEVTYFEHFGDEGLEVRWSGPGFAERPLGFDVLFHLEVSTPPVAETAFVLDRALVARGAELYAALGCASCHDGAAPLGAPFAELDPRAGCLAEDGSVRYALAPEQRADLAAAVVAGTPPFRDAAARLEHTLARLDCRACHARDGSGGPMAAEDDTRAYFQVASGLDLGDQGRFPPALDRVGAKLKPEWFQAVLAGARARPYMKTRMPRFGTANVEHLPALFAEVDAPLRDEREPAFSAEAVEAGKRLAGTKGLGCIQCHELAGHPSIGIPAVDLARVHERIYPGWFRELLMDPVAIQMNTRMPAFWVDGRSPVKDVLDGDPAAQVDALWTYLSLGSSMPLPSGLVPMEGEFEVEAIDEPVCVGVFMAGVSPRTICVGLPERVHYAFDVEHSRLAMAWRGRFLDARGTWYARAGQLERPAGEDVIEFPPGPGVASLPAADAPWPVAADRVLGRTVDDARRPVFRYLVGDVQVSESVVPEIRVGGASIRRVLTLDSPSNATIDLRIAAGREIAPGPDGSWIVEGGRQVRVRVSPAAWNESARVVPTQDGGTELRLRHEVGTDFAPANTGRESAHSSRIEVEYSW